MIYVCNSVIAIELYSDTINVCKFSIFIVKYVRNPLECSQVLQFQIFQVLFIC